eukprot:10332301-Ditylum_brightwellii.AAC.1
MVMDAIEDSKFGLLFGSVLAKEEGWSQQGTFIVDGKEFVFGRERAVEMLNVVNDVGCCKIIHVIQAVGFRFTVVVLICRVCCAVVRNLGRSNCGWRHCGCSIILKHDAGFLCYSDD